MDIFLDVDDLQEFGCLADEVAASDVVLLFLSRGYFASKACEQRRLMSRPLGSSAPLGSSRPISLSPRRAPSSTRRPSDWESRSYSSTRRTRTRVRHAAAAGEGNPDTIV